MPRSLESGLVQRGWEKIGDNAFRNDFPLADGRSQTIFFGSYDWNRSR